MDCPRCAASVDRYALGEREAVVCGSCGYVGVPVEHRGEEDDSESWDEAIARFRDRHRRADATVDDADLTPAIVPIDGE